LSGSYNADDGTSFAAPHVSGIAALILSVNPNLTWQQVQNIIESTAQPLTGYPPNNPSRPNWNNQVGYGLVNAFAAAQAACATASINFTTPTVSTTQTVTGGNINVQNVTVTSGATLTIKANCDINVQGVTVKNNSKLILDASGKVNIIKDFDVQLGSEFEIKYP
jgi:subtilisin family serine protease